MIFRACADCSNGVAAMSIAHAVIQSVAWESPLCKMFARIILINFSFILAFALVFEFVKDFRCADCAVAQRG